MTRQDLQLDASAERLSDREHQELFGREAELTELDELLDGLDLCGGTRLVRGEPGVGKSALLQRAEHKACQRGIPVLRTVGVQSEAQMPFAGLHQLLRPILTHVAQLPAVQRDSLLGAFGAGSEARELFLTALAALNLLSEQAGNGLLLVVDDAHWLDAPTCDVLTFIARRLDSDAILLLVSQRDGVNTAFDDAELPSMHLGALDATSAAALLDLRAHGLAQSVRNRLLADAAGNPLALTELPIAWRQHGDRADAREWAPLTTRLERSFSARARDLPQATQTLLLVAALNDGGTLADTLEAASLLTGTSATLDDLTPAETAWLIELEQDEVRFRHPLIRSAVRQGASTSQLRRAHAALAEALATDHDRRVWHLAAFAIGPDEAVAAELEVAADRAKRRAGATVVAAEALRRAAELTSDPTRRGSRLVSAAESAFESGHHELVAELLDKAEPLELAAHDRQRIEALREFILHGTGAGTVESLVRIAQEMLADGRTAVGRRCLQTAAEKCWWMHPNQASRDLVLSAVDRMPEANDDAQLLAIQAFADPVARGALVLERLERVIPRIEGDVDMLLSLGTALTVVPDCEHARMLLEGAVAQARTEGRMGLVAQALVSLVDASLYSGDWDLTRRAAEECARLASETGRQQQLGGFSRLNEGALAGMRGDRDGAAILITEAERALLPLALAPHDCFIAIARSAAAIGAGDYAEAYEHIRRVFDPTDTAYDLLVGSRGLIDLVDAGVRLGREQEPRAAVAQLEDVVARNRSPFIATSLSYAQAMLAGRDETDALYAIALDEQPARIPFLRARAQLSYGTWLRREQRIAESRDPLRSARDGFDALGAGSWAERARQELRASGERSPRRSPEKRDDLTPQELQIARMAGEGLTNREIGQRLFLSHRTVGSHLYRIFPKLGIGSRSELMRAMATEAGASS